MQIDWNDPNLSDEAVVRAADSDFMIDHRGRVLRGDFSYNDWNSARRNDAVVVAFEQANRPVQEAAGDGFKPWVKDFKHRYQNGVEFTAVELDIMERAWYAAWTACAERGKR